MSRRAVPQLGVRRCGCGSAPAARPCCEGDAEPEGEDHRGGPGQEVQTSLGERTASIVRARSGRGGRGFGRRFAFAGRVPLVGGTTIAGLLAVAGRAALAGLLPVAGLLAVTGRVPVAGLLAVTGLLLVAGLLAVTGLLLVAGLLAVTGRVPVAGPLAPVGLRGHEHRDRVRGDRHRAALGVPARALDDLVGAI